MTLQPAPNIKEKVRERYAAIAVGSSSCCCDDAAPSAPAPSAVADIQLVDYTPLHSDVVAGSDLGLGCGTPTQFAALQPGETVLDLGSGAGIDVFLAAQAVGPTGLVLGVDMTPEMLARAQANAVKAGFRNVEFRQGEIENLPVDSDSIDVILSNCVINLAPDKAPVFAEMYRVLKPGGRFVISDMVTFGHMPPAIRADMALWTGCIAGALDREVYLDLLAASGFQQVGVVTEQRYDPSSLPKTYQQAELAQWQAARGAFGMASVTVAGRK